MTDTAQWFSEATPAQLRELIEHVDCLPDSMAATFIDWAREKTPWYAGIDTAVALARSMCGEGRQ